MDEGLLSSLQSKVNAKEEWIMNADISIVVIFGSLIV